MATRFDPLFNNSENGGINSCVIGMIAHGLISPGLFLLVGFMYERTNTRNMLYYGGYSHILPLLSSMGLIIILASMGIPGTLNFIGEVYMLLNVMGGLQPLTLIVLSLGMFATLIYSLKTYTYTFTGLPVKVLKNNEIRKEVNSNDLQISEAICLGSCWIPILICGIYFPASNFIN